MTDTTSVRFAKFRHFPKASIELEFYLYTTMTCFTLRTDMDATT